MPAIRGPDESTSVREVRVLGADGAAEVAARAVDGRVLVDPDAFEVATGFVHKPEGLCRDALCVPVRDRGAVERDGLLDLEAASSVLGAPYVADLDAGVAAIGEPASLRAAAMDSVDAPDFTLADFGGGTFTFSSIGRKKKLLVTWASW